MPSALLSRINLDLIYPPFLDALMSLLSEANGFGTTYFATSGFRSVEDQRLLHETYLKGGPLAAPAGLSAHNYGLAVDVARRVGKTGVTWDRTAYEPLDALCKKHGLVWGGGFNDPPHIQWPGYVNGRQLLPLKIKWLKQKLDEPTLSELDQLQKLWQSL